MILASKFINMKKEPIRFSRRDMPENMLGPDVRQGRHYLLDYNLFGPEDGRDLNENLILFLERSFPFKQENKKVWLQRFS